ncbi:MAG: prolyl oligopeptidase family serine peptidase [Myxococcota bacterium]
MRLRTLLSFSLLFTMTACGSSDDPSSDTNADAAPITEDTVIAEDDAATPMTDDTAAAQGDTASPVEGDTVTPVTTDTSVEDASGPAAMTWADYAAEIPAVKRERVAAEVCADGFIEGGFEAGQHDGYLAAAQMRGFYLGLPDPDVYPGPRPLLLALNGTGGTGQGAFDGYGAAAFVADGYIVLAPDSNANGVVWPSWYSMIPPGTADENNPDLIYIDSLLDCASAHLEVDENRLYAAGQSAGGIMTNFVLQHRPEVFAGGVPASSIFDLTSAIPPLEMQPMAIVVMWGGDNDIYSGGSEQENVSVPEIDFREQAAIASAFWEGVDGGNQVHCKGAELGHSWVHGANDFVREFLTAHPKGLAQNPGWSFDEAPMVIDGTCSEDVYEYEAAVVVECGESETEGCQTFCQLLGDCLAENGTVAPVLGPSLEVIGFNETDCSGCLTTCEATVVDTDPAMACFQAEAETAQCGDGITGALPAINAVNSCCFDKPESGLCGMVCGAILSVSVALSFVEDGCAPWIPEVPCATNADCGDGQHCDFDDDACGWLGGDGICVDTPENNCDEGGPGACGCGPGALATNGCEIEASGADISSLGGCSPNDDEEVICGDTVCNRMTEYCMITMNDVVGDDQPAWFASCASAACVEPGPPSCACVPEGEQGWCHDTTGYPMVINPGG